MPWLSSCLLSPEGGWCGRVPPRVIPGARGYPPAPPPPRLCQKVSVATAAIEEAREPAAWIALSMLEATTATSLSASTETSPSREVVSSYFSCTSIPGTVAPVASKSIARVEEVPTSRARTKGEGALKFAVCSISIYSCLPYSFAIVIDLLIYILPSKRDPTPFVCIITVSHSCISLVSFLRLSLDQEQST